MTKDSRKNGEIVEQRIYPACCTAAYCGEVSCEDCPDKPALDEFKAWVKETGAEPADPIWSRLVYVVRKPAKETA